MNNPQTSRFVYVTYIRTTPERVWSALTTNEFAQQYWLGILPQADWRAGGSWQLLRPNGQPVDEGEIEEFDAPRRLSLRWRHVMRPELKAEGWSRCIMTLEPTAAAVKLTVDHSIEQPASKFIEAVSGGWPQILSNLKSLLETGSTLLPARTFA